MITIGRRHCSIAFMASNPWAEARRTLQVVNLAQRAGFDVAHVSMLNRPGFRNRVYQGLAARPVRYRSGLRWRFCESLALRSWRIGVNSRNTRSASGKWETTRD